MNISPSKNKVRRKSGTGKPHQQEEGKVVKRDNSDSDTESVKQIKTSFRTAGAPHTLCYLQALTA